MNGTASLIFENISLLDLPFVHAHAHMSGNYWNIKCLTWHLFVLSYLKAGGQTEERGAGLTSDIPVWYGLDWWVLEMWTLVWWTLITGYSKQTIENQSTKLSLCYNKMVAAEWVCQCQFLLSPYNNRKWQFLCGVIISELVSTVHGGQDRVRRSDLITCFLQSEKKEVLYLLSCCRDRAGKN